MFSPTYAPIRTITKTAPRETAEERAARECLEMWRRGLNRR